MIRITVREKLGLPIDARDSDFELCAEEVFYRILIAEFRAASTITYRRARNVPDITMETLDGTVLFEVKVAGEPGLIPPSLFRDLVMQLKYFRQRSSPESTWVLVTNFATTQSIRDHLAQAGMKLFSFELEEAFDDVKDRFIRFVSFLLSRPAVDEPKDTKARRHLEMAAQCASEGKIDETRLHLERATDEYIRLGDQLGLGMTLKQTATFEIMLGNPKHARVLLEDAAAIGTREGLPELAGEAFVAIGQMDLREGRIGQARVSLGKALTYFRTPDQIVKEARVLFQIGLLEASMDRYEDAKRSMSLSLDKFRKSRILKGQAAALHQLGLFHSRTHDYVEARNVLNEAVDLWRMAGDPEGEMISLTQLGSLSRRQVRT